MNKLYIIKCMLESDDDVMTTATKSVWDESEAHGLIIELINRGWAVSLEEDNEIHKIWVAV